MLEEHARFENKLHGYLTMPTTDYDLETRYTVTRRETEPDENSPTGSRAMHHPLIVLYVERNWAEISQAKDEMRKVESNLAQAMQMYKSDVKGSEEGRKSHDTQYRDQEEKPTFTYQYEARMKENKAAIAVYESRRKELVDTLGREDMTVHEIPADLKGVTLVIS